MEERGSSEPCCFTPWRILWKREAALSNVVVRLGEFHTSMVCMAIIGKRFGDAGLRDVLQESEIVSVGSIDGV